MIRLFQAKSKSFSVDSNEKQNTFVRIERKKAVPVERSGLVCSA